MRTLAWSVPLLAVLCVLPLIDQDQFVQRVEALIMLAAISASAWNLIGGYAGQVSVGHAVYFGSGAYSALLVYTKFGWPPVAGAPLGIVVSLALATVIGLPTFRLSGHYFSMATIAAAELVRLLVTDWVFVGAAVGMMGPAVPRSVADLQFIDPGDLLLDVPRRPGGADRLTWWMERSRIGYYLRAINGSERAARSLGVNVRSYKLFALLLSAAFTSIAGTLYALMVSFADPDSTFGILVSVRMLIVAALGGAGTLFGPLIGAFILIPLEEVTNAAFGGSGTGVTYVVYGAVVLIIARFRPGGLAAIIPGLRRAA